jgi:hypothetical protein
MRESIQLFALLRDKVTSIAGLLESTSATSRIRSFGGKGDWQIGWLGDGARWG